MVSATYSPSTIEVVTQAGYAEVMKEYGKKHITSSLKYPLGNNEAERTVQTCKRLLEKSDDPYLALMHYQATPLSNG